jgi:hypothetical protein
MTRKQLLHLPWFIAREEDGKHWFVYAGEMGNCDDDHMVAKCGSYGEANTIVWLKNQHSPKGFYEND